MRGPMGSAGAILRAQDGSTVLKQQNPPAGYALAAFYWYSADANTVVPWKDDAVQVCIEGNPTLFQNPSSHCDDSANEPEWHNTSDLDDTADEIGDVLEELLQAIERDDPTVSVHDYVAQSGITLAGRELVDDAFPQLAVIAPDAFIPHAALGAGDTIPDPSALKIPGASSAWSQNLKELGESFGIPFIVMGLLMLVILFVGVFMVIRLAGNVARPVAVIYIGPVLLTGGFIGVPPFLAVVGLIAVAVIISAGTLINRFWPN